MVIRMRHTRAHTRNRRSHHALKETSLVACTNCKGMTRPHHMCLSCGFYKGRQVLDLSSLKVARDARMKAKRERIRAESGVTPTAAREEAPQLSAGEVKEEVKAKTARKTTRTRKVDGASSSKTKEEN